MSRHHHRSRWMLTCRNPRRTILVAKSTTFDMYKCINVIICMVHSTSTKSMDITEIKNHKQNLLSRILHREKYIRATSRVNPLSLSTRETMLTWSLSHNHGCQSIIEISPLCSFTLLYITILHFYMLISFLIWPASSLPVTFIFPFARTSSLNHVMECLSIYNLYN